MLRPARHEPVADDKRCPCGGVAGAYALAKSCGVGMPRPRRSARDAPAVADAPIFGVIHLIDALAGPKLGLPAHVLGFSLGSFGSQEIALTRPAHAEPGRRARRLLLVARP
jgi:hypothetical protein